uniref:Uncharacterized protein n=1 Tax=Arundo donax TaxID=35708 RepID=A0A0A9C6D1_ARUDO
MAVTIKDDNLGLHCIALPLYDIHHALNLLATICPFTMVPSTHLDKAMTNGPPDHTKKLVDVPPG